MFSCCKSVFIINSWTAPPCPRHLSPTSSTTDQPFCLRCCKDPLGALTPAHAYWPVSHHRPLFSSSLSSPPRARATSRGPLPLDRLPVGTGVGEGVNKHVVMVKLYWSCFISYKIVNCISILIYVCIYNFKCALHKVGHGEFFFHRREMGP